MQNLISEHIFTMSSRKIAELTGKRHPDVKRDIEIQAKQKYRGKSVELV